MDRWISGRRSDGYEPREGLRDRFVVDGNRVRLLWHSGDSISELDTTSARRRSKVVQYS